MLKKLKQLQRSNYDSRHGIHQMPSIPDDSELQERTDIKLSNLYSKYSMIKMDG